MSEHTEGFATYVAMELRAECARKRLTGRQLAHHIHRPVTTVSRWLNGTTPIGVDDLALVCDSLDLSVAEIAQRAEHLMQATRATSLASGRTPVDQVTSVTKRYVMDADRYGDLRQFPQRNDLRLVRPGRPDWTKRPIILQGLNNRPNYRHKIVS